MDMSDLPEIYTQARWCNLSAYISGKSLVPMLQLIYSTWVIHLQACKLQECFASVFIWDHVNFDCECHKSNDKVLLEVQRKCIDMSM